MNDHIASTSLRVSGVRTQEDVNLALQSLYDVFADLGLGAAAFEVTESETADLFVKHLDSVTVDVDAIDAALASAGGFRVVR
ncbi:hypothetical protein [Homoserinimonas sp. A520]